MTAPTNISMTVVPVGTAITDLTANAYAVKGNAALNGGYFYFVNDGRVVIIVVSGTGDTFTFASVADELGRLGDITFIVAGSKTAISQTFPPEGFNQEDGTVRVTPTVGHANDYLLAVRI